VKKGGSERLKGKKGEEGAEGASGTAVGTRSVKDAIIADCRLALREREKDFFQDSHQ